MHKEEWIARCAARYTKCAGLTHQEAHDVAEVCFTEDKKDGDFTNSPEEAADEDMSCWTNDDE